MARIGAGRASGSSATGTCRSRDRLAIARVARRARRSSTRPSTTARRSPRCSGGSASRRPAIDRFWDVFIRPGAEPPVRGGERRAGALHRADGPARRARRERRRCSRSAPLGAMHGEAAGAALASGGATVRTGERVVGLDDRVGRPRRRRAGGGRRGRGRAAARARAHACSASRIPALEDSPIVSVHLLFDRPILEFELAALLGSPAHWVFDRGRLTGQPARSAGQYLTVVSSGAPELLEVRGRGLVDLLARRADQRGSGRPSSSGRA